MPHIFRLEPHRLCHLLHGLLDPGHDVGLELEAPAEELDVLLLHGVLLGADVVLGSENKIKYIWRSRDLNPGHTAELHPLLVVAYLYPVLSVFVSGHML